MHQTPPWSSWNIAESSCYPSRVVAWNNGVVYSMYPVSVFYGRHFSLFLSNYGWPTFFKILDEVGVKFTTWCHTVSYVCVNETPPQNTTGKWCSLWLVTVQMRSNIQTDPFVCWLLVLMRITCDLFVFWVNNGEVKQKNKITGFIYKCVSCLSFSLAA